MTISQRQNMLKTYTAERRTPRDFAEKWQERMAEKWDASIEPVEFSNPCGIYEKMVVTTESRRISARCIRPADDRKHPLILMFHDLNRGVRGWHHMTRFIALGYAVIALDARPDLRDWRSQPGDMDLESRYCDALTLANAALSQPYVDPQRIVTWGEGFGAGLAMVAAAMLPGNVKCAALNPMPAAIRELCGDMSEDALGKLDYVDLLNFAPLIRGEVLLGVCLMDEVAPPEGQYAVYNTLACTKFLKVYPKYAHERVNFFENEVLKFLHQSGPV